jgi:beta-xylosidase
MRAGGGLVAALLLGGCAASSGGGLAGAAPVNPLFAGADPAVLVEDGRVCLFPTGPGSRLHAWCRDADGTWRQGPALIALADIAWRADGAPRHYLWAPDIVRADGRLYLYYSLGPQNPTPSRIGVAVADTLDGPFVDSGRALLTGGNGFEAIDPAIFVDPADGRRYLLAGGSAGATLRMFELGSDMVSLAREIAVEQPPNFTEGAHLMVRDGIYYLSYSHGSWQRSDYSVHYATARSATGPWTYRGAILTSDGRYKGPGHHSFYRDPADGEWRIVYHRWENAPGDGPYTGKRRIAIERLRFAADGAIVPVTMTP